MSKWIIVIILALLVLLGLGYMEANAGEISVKNCVPNTGIGIAKFNDDMTDFKIFDDLRVYCGEKKVWALDKGKYCITFYNMKVKEMSYIMVDVDDDTKEEINFGCGENSSNIDGV